MQNENKGNSATPPSVIISALQESEKRKGGRRFIEETKAENFPNLKTEIQIQEAQRSPKKITTRRVTPRHKVIKMATNSDK